MNNITAYRRFFAHGNFTQGCKSSLLLSAFLALSFSLLSACGSSGSGGGAPKSTSISGYVIDGPISNSSVTLHKINADGSAGDQVAGPFITNENGEWTGSAPGSSEILLVVATGGQYTDDATGATITLSAEETMNSWYDPAKSAKNRVVSPITDSLWQSVKQSIVEGETVADSVAEAEQVAMNFWGLDPTDVVPDVGSTSSVEQRYGVFLAAFSFLMNNNAALQVEPFVSMARFTLMRLLMDDFADGRLDGIGIDGSPILAADGTQLPVLSEFDLSAFFNEANAYAETLQIDPVEADPSRYYGASCPMDGIIIYKRREMSLAKPIKVDHRNMRIISNVVPNGITGEKMYIDSYFISFLDDAYNDLSFTISATRSKGSSLTGWRMFLDGGGQYGVVDSSDPERVFKDAYRVTFKKGSMFALSPGFAEPAIEYFICGSFLTDTATGGSNPIFPPAGEQHDDKYFVGGFVNGLNGTLGLKNNEGAELSINNDGRFTFPDLQDDLAFFNLSILTQPEGQICSLSRSAGQIKGDNIYISRVDCVSDGISGAYTVSGSATGVTGSVVLRNIVNAGGPPYTTSMNAGETSFAFADMLQSGDSYDVSVFSTARGVDCSVLNGTGTVVDANITDVSISCIALPGYKLGGTVSGLSGSINLRNRDGQSITVNSNGAFEFLNPLYSGEDYRVTILSSPMAQVCSVANSGGNIVDADITTVQVSCVGSSALSNLQISQVALVPSFSANQLIYQMAVTNDISSIIITPSAADSNASILVNGVAVTSGSASAAINLAEGNNNIPLIVTAVGNASTTNYSLIITREATLRSNADLALMGFSDGAISPTFDKTIFNYSASVSFSTSSVTVTPTVFNFGATIKVNGNDNGSGQTSSAINLIEGENVININVLAEDGVASQLYKLTVTRQSASAFVQEAYIKSSISTKTVGFGSVVSLSANTLAVGVPLEGATSTKTGYGAVYIFTRTTDGIWSEKAILKASNSQIGDSFGASIALSGDTLAIGAPEEDSPSVDINPGNQGDNNSNPNGAPTDYDSGAVYLFKRASNGTWQQTDYIKAPTSQGSSNFGSSVALENDRLAIGALFMRSNNASGVNSFGSAYIYNRDTSGVWTLQATIKASNIGGSFGSEVSLSGETLAVAAVTERSKATGIDGDGTDTSLSAAGAVYVFTHDGVGNWTQQAYIKASNTGENDLFGYSIQLSGETLAVGAIRESSNATGVGGDETNNLSILSGAAYVFTRNTSGVWSQQAYIKASNTADYSLFGEVSLLGNTLAVGSVEEKSLSTGVNGDQTNSGVRTGAVYLFTRDASDAWTQQAYIKASNISGYFGAGVSLSSSLLAIGAPQEDGGTSGINGDDTTTGNVLKKVDSGAVYILRTQ